MGWKINEVTKFAANISPAHIPISRVPVTFRSCARYNVRNGVIMVMPAFTKNCPNQSTMRLIFQRFNVLVTSFLSCPL
ncbi:hypothetical protein JCM10914_4150 [Paenibacillus sp. JCM 10914]|nr:hypothetical protein JCM10914_4150 [Paenibacillus sp. JCM 10914]